MTEKRNVAGRRTTNGLVSELDALRTENERLRSLERQLALAIDSLRASEERLRLAVEAAHIGIWEWDILSNRVTWDAKKHDVFGVAHGSFAGTKEAFFELVHPDDRQTLQLAIAQALDRGRPYQNEFRIAGSDGATRWIANLGEVYRDDEGRALRMVGVVYDVTDRKLTEDALRDEKDKFRSIVETTREWIWALDRDGVLTYSNSAVETILGYIPEELTGCPLRSLVHEDDLATVEDALSKAIANRHGWSALVVRCRHRDGTYRHLECQGATVVDEAGNVVGFRGSDRDVTDRLEAEAKRRELHRMEGVSRLAGDFAHYFNNLLTVIVGHVEMVLDGADDETVRGDLLAIRRAAQRAALLTRQILTFAGKQFVAPQIVSVNDQIERLSEAIRRSLGGNIELVTDLSQGLWPVIADPSQLDVLVVNLAVNAQEAMPNGGTLTVATANAAVDNGNGEVEVSPGEYVVIAVSDTGAGIAEEIAPHVFEPFFSTKEIGPEPVGLGLSACHGIVTQLGGHIRVESRQGRGSLFRVYLPRASQTVQV